MRDRQHFSLEALFAVCCLICFVFIYQVTSSPVSRQTGERRENQKDGKTHRQKRRGELPVSDRIDVQTAVPAASDRINRSLQQTREGDLCRLTRARLMGSNNLLLVLPTSAWDLRLDIGPQNQLILFNVFNVFILVVIKKVEVWAPRLAGAAVLLFVR